MNRLSVACVAGALLGSGLTACQTVTPPEGATIVAVQDRPATLRQGDVLSVRLPANPSTGFAWVLKPYDEAVLNPSSPFNEVEPGVRADGAVGVPGEAVWRFEAGSPGRVALTFEYRQVWSDDAPAQTAIFPVTVQ